MRKVLQCFLPICEFRRHRGPLGPRFINLGTDIQQGPIYQSAKFRPVVTTYVVCTRYLLPDFVDFVDSVTDIQTRVSAGLQDAYPIIRP